MKVHIQKLGSVTILHIRGTIVIGETDVLRNAVASQGDASVVVLDVARVTRIDAGGLGVLLKLREQARNQGIEFRIMNVTRLVQQVLEITKLNTVFEVTSQRELMSLTTPPVAEKAIGVEL